MTLTRIDEDLITYDFYDSLDEAERSFFELMSLEMAYIAYACTADGSKKNVDYSLFEKWIPDKLIPKTVADGHILNLSAFRISSRQLIDAIVGNEDGIEINPRPGINLSPICLFDGMDEIQNAFNGVAFFMADNKIEGTEYAINSIPVKDVNSLKPTDILSDDIIINPIHYEMMAQQLSAVTSFRLSVFQPILAGCGVGCIQLPILDGSIWLPGIGVLEAIDDKLRRKDMPKYDDIMPKVENYLFETRAKINILYDELGRRKGAANPPKTKRIQEKLPDGGSSIKTVELEPVKKNSKNSEKKSPVVRYRWSIMMSKKKACDFLGGWSMGTLNAHIAQNPDIARMQRNRQHWRFNCDDPSFASLPIDENYNKNM